MGGRRGRETLGKFMVRELSKEIVAPYHTAALGDIRAQVKEVVSQSQFDANTQRLLVLAADEAVSCILGQAVDSGREGQVSIALKLDNVCFKVVVSDSNCDDNGTDDLSPNELDAAIKKARRYKLGVFVMRKIMDEVSYQFKKGFENQLTLVKYVV